ncbi:MAG TPA: SDR family NAD(P)-dependent oxidoreductase, partial [Terriglobales bacterium]|nr:SDR family NAD(P)-dependent oxidoreductase [Terriglobales bacterium]
MKQKLDDKVAVVTGGGRGIGAAIASKLAGLGAAVVICGRTRKAIEDTAKSISQNGLKAEAIECDVTDLRSVESLAQHVESNFGRLDVLINNSGIGSFKNPLHLLPPDEWDKVLNTNLRGVYYCIRSFAPLMIRGGGG